MSAESPTHTRKRDAGQFHVHRSIGSPIVPFFVSGVVCILLMLALSCCAALCIKLILLRIEMSRVREMIPEMEKYREECATYTSPFKCHNFGGDYCVPGYVWIERLRDKHSIYPESMKPTLEEERVLNKTGIRRLRRCVPRYDVSKNERIRKVYTPAEEEEDKTFASSDLYIETTCYSWAVIVAFSIIVSAIYSDNPVAILCMLLWACMTVAAWWYATIPYEYTQDLFTNATALEADIYAQKFMETESWWP